MQSLKFLNFYRLHAPRGCSATPPMTSTTRKFLTLNLGSKFRYSGRNELKKPNEKHLDKVDQADLSRNTALRRTLPLHLEPANITDEQKRTVPRLASPETSSIGSSVHSNGGLKPKPGQGQVPPASVPKRGQVDPDATPTNSHTSLAHRAIESFNHRVQSLSSKLPKKAWADEPTSDDEGEHSDKI